MARYDTCSKEELLRIITELETENKRLKAGKGKSKTPLNSDTEIVSGRFREKYAQKILDTLPDMLTVLSADGKLVDLVSSEKTNHVGEPSCQLLGRDISTMLTPEAYRNVKQNLDHVIATGKGSTSHHDITLDGVTNHYENRIYMLDKEYALCMCRDVTEEQKAKEKLEQANRRMKKAEEINSLSHWYYYASTKEFESEDLLSKLPGLKGSGNRCSLTSFLSFVHTADRTKLQEQIENPEETGKFTEFRIFINGKLHFLHSRVIYVYHENGEWIMEGYTQDVTHIAERLHTLEVTNYALNNVVEEIFACDPDGHMVFTNKQFRTHNQITEDPTELRIFEFEPLKSTRQQWDERVRSIRKNGGMQKFTIQFRNPDKQVIVMEIDSYLIYDHTQEREIIWFFGRDISLKISQETKIKEMNSLMNTIINNIPVYLFVKDPGNEFRYLYWNKAFEEYSGIPASKALGSTDYEIFPDPIDAEKFRHDDLRLLREGKRIEIDEQYTSLSGESRIVSTSKALVPAENRLPLIIGISWDITDLKNTQKELIEARVRAEESDRLKSAFLANMSHEIRTPLNAIVGFSKLLTEAETEEEKRQYAEILDSNSELLLQLINDILDISKIEAGTLEFHHKPVNLNELCRAQQEIHRSRVKEGVELVFDEKYDSVEIVADQNRLAQVFTNLITNAIKFTEKGQIRFGFNVGKKNIEFYVSDTGVGIAKEKLATIFDRFVKLNDFAVGTGLGLAISRMIVEKMNGTLRVESTLGSGTIFHFSIPYEKPGKQDTDAGLTLPTSSVAEILPDEDGKHKILVAEDNDSNYMLIEAYLSKKFNLIHARNGKEAVEIWHREKPDAILMDLKMPEMDGFEAIGLIRRESSAVPIIVMSAFAFGDDMNKASEAGCNDYITKPLTQKILIEKLNKYLSGK